MKIDRILDGTRDPRTSVLVRTRLSDVQDIDDILALVSAERAAYLDFLNDPDAQRLLEFRQVAHAADQLGWNELIPSRDELHGTRDCSPDWIDRMAAVNDESSTILDDTIHVFHVPVYDSLAAIAGFLNGLCHRVLVMQKGEIVEDIAATDLTLERVTSPYTRALLAATPTLAERSGL